MTASGPRPGSTSNFPFDIGTVDKFPTELGLPSGSRSKGPLSKSGPRNVKIGPAGHSKKTIMTIALGLARLRIRFIAISTNHVCLAVAFDLELCKHDLNKAFVFIAQHVVSALHHY